MHGWWSTNNQMPFDFDFKETVWAGLWKAQAESTHCRCIKKFSNQLICWSHSLPSQRAVYLKLSVEGNYTLLFLLKEIMKIAWVPEVHCKSLTASMSTVQKSSINQTPNKTGYNTTSGQYLITLQCFLPIHFVDSSLYTKKQPKISKNEDFRVTQQNTAEGEDMEYTWGIIQHRHCCGNIRCQFFLSIFFTFIFTD